MGTDKADKAAAALGAGAPGWAVGSFGDINHQSVIAALVGNVPLACALLAFTAAQVAKIFTHRIVTSKWDVTRLVSSGGMPSSHSALIVGVVTGVGMTNGLSDPVFAVAACMAMVVMYDACGVRLQAGRHAEALNHIVSATCKNVSMPMNSSSAAADGGCGPGPSGDAGDEDSISGAVGDSVAIDIGSSSTVTKRKQQQQQQQRPSFFDLSASTASGHLNLLEGVFPLSFYEKKFKESIGHTPMQVLMGALTGFIVPYIMLGPSLAMTHGART